MAILRLDKFLADAGLGTRSEVKQYIKKKRITVNNKGDMKSDTKINVEQDVVCFDGKIITGKQLCNTGHKYFILHKPAGFVCATRDLKEKTVLDLLSKTDVKNLFPIGRLDKDTEGLLILTDDGLLAHDLLSPRKHVQKTYFVRVDGFISQEMVKAFCEGFHIGTVGEEKKDKLTLPAQLSVILASEHESEAMVTIHEGRYHQIKRMFQVFHCRVLYLKRISMGNLKLPVELKCGDYRKMTENEVLSLQEKTNLCDTNV